MFDLKEIREAPERFDAGWTARGLGAQSAAIVALDQRRRAVLTELQTLQAERNDASKRVGQAKASGDHAGAQALIDRVGEIKARIQAGEEEAQAIEAEIDERLSALPNLPRADVPVGADEHANVEVRRWGEPQPMGFAPKQHYEIGEALGLMDFEAAARMSGARFVVLKGALARLERAIGQLMLDTHTTDYGYTEVSPPLLVWDRTMFGTGQLPKFREEQFRAGTDHWLVPTAEVPLTNLVREQILGADELPKRLTALTPCFRAEAGAAGRDTRGMIRLHQFLKVELVSITAADASEAELERMTACATSILERLALPYRVMALSTGDMGFSARKTYDIEVWLPGQDAYREISSCSDCGDFQARRMGARYRPHAEASPRFVHTLNGSGLAVGRTLVAILENYQQADGTVRVPEALIPYMGGISVIRA